MLSIIDIFIAIDINLIIISITIIDYDLVLSIIDAFTIMSNNLTEILRNVDLT